MPDLGRLDGHAEESDTLVPTADWYANECRSYRLPQKEESPMKANVHDTYAQAEVPELRDIDKPVQDTYGSADVQTATGGTR
jgi:hypothetical protein